MDKTEAKQISRAIVTALISFSKGEVDKLQDKIVEILTAEPTAPPVEKEYRAGEWVPPEGCTYWYITDDGATSDSINTRHAVDAYRLSQGNVSPTKAIAEAAKKHAEFWRAFDMADEGGIWELSVNTQRNFLRSCQVSGYEQSGSPKFKSEERAREWIAVNGGEAYVSEMLTKGRVFRFKWGAG